MLKPSPSTNFDRLIKRLKVDHPDIKFVADEDFYWSPTKQTLFYKTSNEQNACHLLLHELAHAKLQHTSYFYDNELIKLELAAWEYSRHNFYPKYLTKFDQNLANDYLDYYRNWLYDRSRCPSCQSTGQQTEDLIYHCPICNQKWRVNPAKFTQLRRQKLK